MVERNQQASARGAAFFTILQNITIGRKIAAGFGVLLVMTAALAGAAIHEFGVLRESTGTRAA